MASVGKEHLIDRQLKLDRQRQILEQKRKVRQQQVHSGMVMASGIGSRPTSGRSNSRPPPPTQSNSTYAVPSSDTPTIPTTVINTPSNNTSSNNINLPTLIPSMEMPALSTESEESTSPIEDNEETKLLSVLPVEVKEEEVIHHSTITTNSNIQSLSEKLTSLGLSAAVGGYQSDSSDDCRDGLEDPNEEKLSSPGLSPLHEASVLPQECTEDEKLIQIDGNPLEIKFDSEAILDDLSQVVFKVPKENETVKCRIVRDKQGLDKHMYPIYYMYLEKENNQKFFLLAGRKKKRARSSYYTISTDSVDLSRNGRNFVAKLRSNFVGTSFTVYDNGCKHPSDNVEALREELALVNYETNVLGFKGPRKMSVVMPALDKDSHRINVRPTREPDTLLERFKSNQMSHLIRLHNKQPVWSGDTQAYVLNFHGRVTQASVKNFQLVHYFNEDYVVVQFGRISEDTFTLDYQYPVCAVQAFAIALSSFDSKWACE